MNNLNTGALPTLIITENNKAIRAERIDLFNHYLEHKGTDIPNGRKKSSKKPVIENIINSFANQYVPETYTVQINSKSKKDNFENLKQIAHIIVWEATYKYIWESDKKNKNYRDRFDFCIFASNYLKFQLKLQLRKINRDRIYGNLPDSDKIRKLYTILPKYKKNNPYKKYLNFDDYKKISKKYNIKINLIKEVDQFFTSKAISGDMLLSEGEQNNLWEVLEKENSEFLYSNQNIEEQLDRNFKNRNLRKITLEFLKTLSTRNAEIFNEIKINDSENKTLKELSIKFKLSPERIRQISENIFNDYKILLKKNKNYLWDE